MQIVNAANSPSPACRQQSDYPLAPPQCNSPAAILPFQAVCSRSCCPWGRITEVRLTLGHLTHRAAGKPIPITPVTAQQLKGWLKAQRASVRKWVAGVGFEAKPASIALVPGADGAPGRVLVGVEAGADIWSYGALPKALPRRTYRIDGELEPAAATRAALGWALGGYAFARYKKQPAVARLVWPAGADRAAVERAAAATFLVRNLVNTPAEDMGPAELAAAAEAM